MVTPVAKRQAVAHLVANHEMSERRACRVLGVDRTSVRYQATRPDDGALRDRLKALAQERRRFGYRRLHVLLVADPATAVAELLRQAELAHAEHEAKDLGGVYDQAWSRWYATWNMANNLPETAR